MMFARSLLIQFPFFIHKRRVAAVGAKFPFSLVRARPPAQQQQRLLPLCIYTHGACCARLLSSPIYTQGRQNVHAASSSEWRPTNPRLLIQFSNLPYLFFHKTFQENIL